MEYSYLTDIIKCLRLLPVTYDTTAKDKAFNYYYINKKVSPGLNPQEQIEFNKYLNKLLITRNNSTFGIGNLSLINPNNSNLNYIKDVIEFHKWCVAHGVLKDVPLPPLRLPCNVLQQAPTQGVGNNQMPNSNDPQAGGSITDHSKDIGNSKFIQVFPDIDTSNPIFNEQLKNEKQYIANTLSNYRQDTQRSNLDGLFTIDYEPTNMINRPIIPNFFNNNRLEDMVLFEQPGKTFNNVSIYRDISGSTHSNELFTLIDKVCGYLNTNIPIDKHFYLYSSGKVSIMETEYVSWTDPYTEPQEYLADPIYKQLGGGTNSDAIADVMSTQLDDKWLNIIVTDGDLHALFSRTNIESLLHNIAVIDVRPGANDNTILEGMDRFKDHYIRITSEDKIPLISNMLINFKED